MPTTTRFATQDTAVSGTWSNPTNVQAADGNVASTTIASKNTTNTRRQGNFGFDGVIPADAFIDAVFVEVRWRVSTAASIATLRARIGRSGTYATAVDDSAEPTALTVAASAALARPGGGSWERADLLNGVLNTELQAVQGNNATSCTYEYDYVAVIVDWTPALVVEDGPHALWVAGD